jgi:hypothetical protein
MPTYIHDCTECKFLGTVTIHDRVADLYYCNPSNQELSGTLIARYGDEGPNYSSGIGFAMTSPVLALAAVRAIVLGYMNAAELQAHCNPKQLTQRN